MLTVAFGEASKHQTVCGISSTTTTFEVKHDCVTTCEMKIIGNVCFRSRKLNFATKHSTKFQATK